MSAGYYTIRYRSDLHHDSVTLIVEDESGVQYVYNCHPDHCRLIPLAETDLSGADLVRLGWQCVPEVAPYPLEALRSLMTGALATHQLPPLLVSTSRST